MLFFAALVLTFTFPAFCPKSDEPSITTYYSGSINDVSTPWKHSECKNLSDEQTVSLWNEFRNQFRSGQKSNNFLWISNNTLTSKQFTASQLHNVFKNLFLKEEQLSTQDSRTQDESTPIKWHHPCFSTHTDIQDFFNKTAEEKLKHNSLQQTHNDLVYHLLIAITDHIRNKKPIDALSQITIVLASEITLEQMCLLIKLFQEYLLFSYPKLPFDFDCKKPYGFLLRFFDYTFAINVIQQQEAIQICRKYKQTPVPASQTHHVTPMKRREEKRTARLRRMCVALFRNDDNDEVDDQAHLATKRKGPDSPIDDWDIHSDFPTITPCSISKPTPNETEPNADDTENQNIIRQLLSDLERAATDVKKPNKRFRNYE